FDVTTLKCFHFHPSISMNSKNPNRGFRMKRDHPLISPRKLPMNRGKLNRLRFHSNRNTAKGLQLSNEASLGSSGAADGTFAILESIQRKICNPSGKIQGQETSSLSV